MSRRKRMMENLDQDIRDFIERETHDNIERGMPPEEARYAALRKFGNVTRVREETWEVWSFIWLEQLWQDVRFGLRQLRRSPGFTAVAVLTLALGIGANTAIFTLMDAVILRTLPVEKPGELFQVQVGNAAGWRTAKLCGFQGSGISGVSPESGRITLAVRTPPSRSNPQGQRRRQSAPNPSHTGQW
jgi:hypothetical protein